MSTPWQWLGSYFPTQENTIAAASIGDGTAYPVTWDRTDGAITPNEICQFEWTTKEITLAITGNVTLVFHDYTGGGAPDQTLSTGFSHSIFVDGPTGTTWDVMEPVGDYLVGGLTLQQGGGFVTPVSLPWGPDEFIFGLEFDVTDLLAVDGTTFASYVKNIIADIAISNDPQGSPGVAYSGVLASLNQNSARTINGITFTTPLPTSQGAQVAFHGTPTLYSQTGGAGAAGSSLTISSFALTVTGNYTQPPNI